MTLQEFITNFSGQRVFLDDESYRGECTQIVKIWAKQNGWPIPNSGGTNKALDYKNFTDGYEFIENTPENVPSAGDIVVWGREVGSFGHVAIAVDANTDKFESFDQNWPQGTTCHIQAHNYFGVSGWLHRQNPNPPQASTSTLKSTFDTNLTPGLVNDDEVKRMQTRLQKLGFFPADIEITGNYKSITKKAVFDFQRQYGIIKNSTDYGAGYFGPQTRSALNKI